ncbi:unnamed protein product, partial [Darwinula stevensoni]
TATQTATPLVLVRRMRSSLAMSRFLGLCLLFAATCLGGAQGQDVNVDEVAEIGFVIGRYRTENTYDLRAVGNAVGLIGAEIDGTELVIVVVGDLTSTYPDLEEGAQKRLRINVRDGDDMIPEFNAAPFAFEVPEIFPVGWDFASENTVSISDADFGEQFHTNEISIQQHSDIFYVQPSSCVKECTLKISLLKPLDYEDMNEYQFDILAKGPLQSATAQVTVTVLNEKDEPFIFEEAFYTVQLCLLSSMNTALNRLSMALRPRKSSQTSEKTVPLVYECRSKSSTWTRAALDEIALSFFTIDHNTGALSLTASLNESITSDVFFLVKAGAGVREGTAALTVYLPKEDLPAQDVEFQFESYSFTVKPLLGGETIAELNISCSLMCRADKDFFEFVMPGNLIAKNGLAAGRQYAITLRAESADDVDIAQVRLRWTDK